MEGKRYWVKIEPVKSLFGFNLYRMNFTKTISFLRPLILSSPSPAIAFHSNNFISTNPALSDTNPLIIIANPHPLAIIVTVTLLLAISFLANFFLNFLFVNQARFPDLLLPAQCLSPAPSETRTKPSPAAIPVRHAAMLRPPVPLPRLIHFAVLLRGFLG